MRKFFYGDTRTAQEYVRHAAVLLDSLKNQMRLGGLMQLGRRVILANGVVLAVSSVFGQDTLQIFAPTEAPGLQPVDYPGSEIPGLVIVGVSFDPNGGGFTGRAFRWEADTGAVNIAIPGAGYVFVNGISDDGKVVAGTAFSDGPGPFFVGAAVRWQVGGAWELAGFPAPSEGIEMSGDGKVLVGYGTPGDVPPEAYIGSAQGGVVSLGRFNHINNVSGSRGNRASRDGSVVVGDDWFTAMRWTAATGRVFMSASPSTATGVSSDGKVAALWGSGSDYGAFRWTEAEGLVALPGGDNCKTTAVSSDGKIILGFRFADLAAVMWDAQGVMTELSGLYNPVAISEAGLVVGSNADLTRVLTWNHAVGIKDLNLDGSPTDAVFPKRIIRGQPATEQSSNAEPPARSPV